MAIFDDITGWQEELEALRNSDVFKEIYSREKLRNRAPKIPLSVMSTYVETLLKHNETRRAVEILDEWERRRPKEGVDPDTDTTYPYRERQLLTDFGVWFTLKSGYGPNDWAYMFDGINIARAVMNGDWPKVRCQEAIDYVRTKASLRIDPSS